MDVITVDKIITQVIDSKGFRVNQVTKPTDVNPAYVISDSGVVRKVCAYCGALIAMMDLGLIKIGRITKHATVELIFDEITRQMVEVEVVRYIPSIKTVEGCYDCRMKYFDAIQVCNKREKATGVKREAFLDLRDRP